MPISWTPEQVLSLAPDEASRSNATGLAAPRKWRRLFQNSGTETLMIWGECQGSGAEPYRAQVDIDGPAFHCSCPSRKLPCKHALGLLLLYAGQPSMFEVSAPPDWVTAWLARRAKQSEQRAAKANGRAENADPQSQAKAQARRAAERDRKIHAGLDELETWLQDLLRQGLAAAQGQPRSFWEMAAARLVDAQAPGLARLVRSMADLVATGEGWQERMLDQAARIYLAVEGYRRIAEMPEETQADLRTVLGFTQKQEEILTGAGVVDTWLVLGREIEDETALKTQRTWLWGISTGRPALILSFAPAGGTLDASLIPGSAVPAELVFYPGAFPLRAAIRSRRAAETFPEKPPASLPMCGSLVEATAGYASALARCPWLERYPMLLKEMLPVRENGEWALYDSARRRILLAKNFPHGWTLLALSGGQPVGAFGEWNGERFMPLSAWAAGQFYAFRPRMEQ